MKTVAIIGRTNVGKSSLFNRLCGKKTAIVHDKPGVTRDRKEAVAHFYDMTFRLIDTAGVEEETDLSAAMWAQTQKAVDQADVLLLVVDVRTEISELDKKLVRFIRKVAKPVLLLANKCEGKEAEQDALHFYQLGLGDPLCISAEHGLGMGDLYEALMPYVDADDQYVADTSKEALKLAVVGRPNVGKSTLVNQLLKEERLLTGPVAGVTRDSITVPFSWQGKDILLTDTAGLRKGAKVSDQLEKFSVKETFNTIDFAEVVIVVLDATELVDKQDLMVASHVIEEGRALVLALNKWDQVTHPSEVLKKVQDKLSASLNQIKGVPVVPISALSGKGIDALMRAVFDIYALWNKRLPTHQLNLLLKELLAAHLPPLQKNGKRVAVKYATQVNARPPTFVLFSNNPEALPDSYVRYLLTGIRQTFHMQGVPMRLYIRKRENPYDKKKG